MAKCNKQKKVSEQISDFTKFLRQTQKDYEYHKGELEKEDQISQDLLHQIELGEYKDRRHTATLLSQCRKRRRVHKDCLDTMRYVYEFLANPHLCRLLFDFDDLVGKTRKEEQRIESANRFYKAKVIMDLPICKQTEEKNN